MGSEPFRSPGWCVHKAGQGVGWSTHRWLLQVASLTFRREKGECEKDRDCETRGGGPFFFGGGPLFCSQQNNGPEQNNGPPLKNNGPPHPYPHL